jgi:hypothetical protein
MKIQEREYIEVVKSSGKTAKFSIEKLKSSLKRSGADTATVQHIVDKVCDELYQGISTKEIYNRAFSLLKKKKSVFASKYKLKKAIYELGPTGFPFDGKCVSHEVDVTGRKNDQYIVAECKFHNEEGRKCDVKVPLYINSRYRDILDFWKGLSNKKLSPNEGWVITNTRFTLDALQYGKCVGLHLLSWDYPKGNSLKERIDRLGLYPITVSTLLTKREKAFLLSRDVVLCRQLINDHFYLDHLGVSETRKDRVLKEIQSLCKD